MEIAQNCYKEMHSIINCANNELKWKHKSYLQSARRILHTLLTARGYVQLIYLHKQILG